ncbi:hypothetical protein F5Y07DRAFT_378262 [Xylaria sp. FL0933]|nr:hypothetical protein F5Y07DRAFT_378262 [Xylaria sp. FL0933]
MQQARALPPTSYSSFHSLSPISSSTSLFNMPKRNPDVDLPGGSHTHATEQQFLPPTTRNQPDFNNQPSTVVHCDCDGANANLIDCQAGVDDFNRLWAERLFGYGGIGSNTARNQASFGGYYLGPTVRNQLSTGIISAQGNATMGWNIHGLARPRPYYYAADLANLYEGPAMVDDPQNTCVRITGLPEDRTLRELFYGLAGCGKIYSANLSKIIPFHGHRAASVNFWNLRGVRKLMEMCKQGLFTVNGLKPAVGMNRMTGRSQEQSDKTRVVVIGGPDSLIDHNYMQLLVFDFSYRLEDVLELEYISSNWRSLEYRFSSVNEAEQAMKAICAFKERDDISFAEIQDWRATRVRYGEDPCCQLFGYR